MSDLVIRRAEEGDLEDVATVTVDAYMDGGFVTDGHGYIGALRDAAGRHTDAELWVAELDGAVVGSVAFCPPGSAQREVARDGEGEFRMLAVSPAAQGRGVARALVSICMQRSREIGLTAVAICSLPTMLPAHALYRSLGFEREESRDWSPGDGIVLWGFRAPITPGGAAPTRE